MTTTTDISGIPLTLSEAGSGRPVLVLHGGGGPDTVAAFARHFSRTAHTLLPTHPGWSGTPRPAAISSVPDLAAAYLGLLRERDLTDVVVIGSSMGGWTAAEMAVGDTEGRIGALVLVDAVAIEVPGEPVADYFSLDPRTAAEHVYHDVDAFYVDPATLTAAQQAAHEADIASMMAVAGDFYDAKLAPRLSAVEVPTLVLWGESDRIVTPAYGAALADAFPKGRFTVVAEAGHLPHLEQPKATFAAVESFLADS